MLFRHLLYRPITTAPPSLTLLRYVFALFCGLVPLSVIEDVASLMRQIKGTARNTGRIQLYEPPSATKEAPPLAALKIPGPIPSSCEMPSAAKVENPPIGPRSTLG